MSSVEVPSIQDKLWIKLYRWVQNFWFLSYNSGSEIFLRVMVSCSFVPLTNALEKPEYPSWIQKWLTVILQVATAELWSGGWSSVVRKCGRVWVTWLSWISVVAILLAVPDSLLVTQLTLEVPTYPAQRNITFLQTVSWPQTKLFCFTNQKHKILFSPHLKPQIVTIIITSVYILVKSHVSQGGNNTGWGFMRTRC